MWWKMVLIVILCKLDLFMYFEVVLNIVFIVILLWEEVLDLFIWGNGGNVIVILKK